MPDSARCPLGNGSPGWEASLPSVPAAGIAFISSFPPPVPTPPLPAPFLVAPSFFVAFPLKTPRARERLDHWGLHLPPPFPEIPLLLTLGLVE